MSDDRDKNEGNNPSKNEKLPGPWAKTYAAESKRDMLEAYSEWASTYDGDSVEKFGYIAPKRSAQVLSEYLQKLGRPKDSWIADIGAGTGLVGEELKRMGFTHVVGLDYSHDMLQIANAKSCYRDLHCVDLCDSIDTIRQNTGFDIGSFDAMISVGTFTPNHAGIDELLTAIAFLRSPGGLMVLSLRDDFVRDDSNGFRAKLEELEASGIMRREEVTDPELYTHKVSQSIFFRCWIFTIL